jgi:retron-type reverse transcriptase
MGTVEGGQMDENAIDLMESIVAKGNLSDAYTKVVGNKGAPGVDGMTVEGLLPYLEKHQGRLTGSILNGSYKPKAVRRVEIPKPDGGKRLLGVPTVIDRFVQQAVAQVLVPIFEKTFSEHSHGFRPERSCHDAIRQAKWFQ